MKKKVIFKRILLILLICMLIFFLFINLRSYIKSEASSNLLFIRFFDGYEIRDIRNEDDKNPIIIPEFYNGLPVVGIGTSAFQDSKAVSITFEKPENIRFIEIDAFKNTKATNPIYLPNIKHVPFMAFHNSNFSEIHLDSEKIESISSYAFSDSKATNDISLMKLRTIPFKAFDNSNFNSINLNWERMLIVGLSAFSKNPEINLSQNGNDKPQNKLDILIDVNSQVSLEKLEYQWTTSKEISKKDWIITANKEIVSPINSKYEGDYYLHVRTTPVGKSSLDTVTFTSNKFSFDNISPEKPIMNVSTESLTNKNIIIKATYSTDSFIKEYKVNDSKWLPYSNSIIIKENSIVYTRSFDEAGNMSEIETLNIKNIDKQPPSKPKLEVSTNIPTNENLIVRVNFPSDAFIKEYKLDDGQWERYIGDLTIDKNMVVYARGIDEVGNMSEISSLPISNIDKLKPKKPIINHTMDKLANGKDIVTINVNYSSDSLKRQIKIDSDEWIDYRGSVRFTENTTVYVRGIDAAGNISDIESVVIDKINKNEKEKLYIDYYDEGVKVLIEFPKDSLENKYRINDGEWIDYNEPIILTEDSTISIQIKDINNNIVYSEYVVSTNPNKKSEKSIIYLEEGDFKFKISDINDFGGLRLKAEKQTIKTGFESDFNIIDARGTQDGWTLMVSATPFEVEIFNGFIGTPHKLPTGSLSIKAPLAVEQVGIVYNSQPPKILINDYMAIDGQNKAIKILEAKKYKGMGEFSVHFGEDALELTVDAVTAKIDKINYPGRDTPYVSTVTWDLISSP